jgi:hypothetical protein
MSRPGHGPDGSPHGQDFAEFLRHALHAAADQVEPRPDGLERIRARVRTGTAFTTENAEAPAKDSGLGSWIRHQRARRQRARLGGTAVPAALTHKAAASGRHGRSKSGQARPPLDWRQRMLRPVVAVACAVFAIGVALSLPPLRAAFVQLGSSVGLSSQHTPGASGPSPSSPGRVLGSASGGTLGVATTPATSAIPTVTVCPPSSTAAPAKPATKPSKTVTPTPAKTSQTPPSSQPTTPSPTVTSPTNTVSPSSGDTTSGSPDTSTTATATPAAFTKTAESNINATAKDKTAGTDCVSSSAVTTPVRSTKASTPPVKGKAKGSPSATAETSPTSPASDSTSPSGGDTSISNSKNSPTPSDSASGTDGTPTATPYPHRHH